MSKGVRLIVSGDVFWAKVTKPDESGKFPVYTADLQVDDEVAKLLESHGLRAAEKHARGSGILKDHDGSGRKVFKFSRSAELGKPGVVDANKQPYEGLIGNGSKVRAQIMIGEIKHPQFSGKKGYLDGLQVVKLVEYKPDNEKESPTKTQLQFDKVEGGFTQDDGEI